MKVKVSIIVPVYNVEDYLERCIDAIINQTYKNYELILIDDKSTDKSKDIIIKYSNEFKNILGIFQEKNLGVSVARNKGIEKATGEWIAFCDGDDWYEPNFLEKMLCTAIKNKSDYVICDYYISKSFNSRIRANTLDCLDENYSKKSIVALGNVSSCTHLIRKSLFVDNNVKYPSNCSQFEELPVIPVLAWLCKKISVIDEALYNYFQRGNASSASNSGNLKSYTDNFTIAFSYMKKLLAENCIDELEYYAIYAFYGEMLIACKTKATKVKLKKITREFKNKYPNALKNIYYKKMMIAKKLFILFAYNDLYIFNKLISIIHNIAIN